MKNISMVVSCLFGSVFFLLFFPFSCTGLNLSEDEAKKAIAEGFGYPSYQYKSIGPIRENTEAHRELVRLLDEGYLAQVKSPYFFFKAEATEKGKKKLIREMHLSSGSYKIELASHKLVISEITDILVDKKNGVATVSFVVQMEPVLYFNELCDKCGECKCKAIPKTIQKSTYLKKWDKGWKVR